jgi:hypothetical protein
VSQKSKLERGQSSDDEDEGQYQKCMPHLIYSDGEVYHEVANIANQ